MVKIKTIYSYFNSSTNVVKISLRKVHTYVSYVLLDR
jgi:hypothetical protein